MKNVLIIVGAVLFLIATIVVFRVLKGTIDGLTHHGTSVVINKHTFSVEIAKTPQQQEIGLSSKTSLPQDQGMIFPFSKPDYYRFWMRNMKFPIDIIYFKDKKVVTVFQNVPAPKNANDTLPLYVPDAPSDTVLELDAGIAKKYNIKNGDVATYSL